MVNKERLREALRMVLMMLEESPTVGFEEAVQDMLRAKQERRSRTLSELRSVCRRMMREVPGLAKRKVAEMSRSECAELIQIAPTVRQQLKFRAVLHGLFAHCRRQEWVAVNPVALIACPHLQEHEIAPLEWAALVRLLRQIRLARHRCCMPPVGLMLWAGVRPAELTRLRWSDIDWEESVISLRPQHSKTGGSRHIQLQSVLRSWLREYGMGQGKICPPNWMRRWKNLRESAGLSPWRQDVLRHTFASYHAKYFHDFARLQEDMGHRSAALLRTRYLSMHGLTAAHARLFWTPGAL